MNTYLNKFINFLLVILLLVASGNPIITASTYIREIYVAIFIILIILNALSNHLFQFKNRFLLYLLPFLFISIFQIIFLNVNYSSALFFFLKIFIGYLIIKRLGYEFMLTYANVMFIVALISLPLYAYNMMYGIIPGKPISDIGLSLGIYTELFDEHSRFIGRNAGMFWEPGAFQGYLNIAIAFILLLPSMANKRFKLIILLLALLTTKSTTGYIVLFITIIYYNIFISQRKSSRKVLYIISFLVLAFYIIFTLDFLYDKLHAELAIDSYGQKAGRIYDYIRFRSLIFENFLLGLSDQVAILAYTGNGFISFLLYYGIFGLLNYCTALWYNYRFQMSLHSTILISLVVLISLQGEGFIYYPLYLALPFVDVERKLQIA